MIYDSGEIVTGYRHQFLVKLEWYMTGDFLYQNCFLLLQDETSRLSKFPGANSFHLDSTFQLLEKSELSWRVASLSSAGKLTFHWIHPPHLSWRPKMEETLRLLLKILATPAATVETRLELLSASGWWWWLSGKLANLRFCNPETPSNSSKVVLPLFRYWSLLLN